MKNYIIMNEKLYGEHNFNFLKSKYVRLFFIKISFNKFLQTLKYL